MLKVENLIKRYGNGPVILNGLSFSVREGEIVGVVGPSGGGKTTLMRCLHGLDSPTSGRILMEGHTGLVFQHFNLFPHMTVLRNITYAPEKILKKSPQAARRQALLYLEQFGLEDHKDHYPHELSGGQKQRVAVVRALVMEPKLLILDEPTSALDPHMTVKLEKILKLMHQESIACMIITHDMNFLRRFCTRVLFLLNGGLYADMRTEDFFKSTDTHIQTFIQHPTETEETPPKP